jgi:hypothetical protein
MRESRLSGSVEGVMRNHDPYSDSPEPSFRTTKVYSGVGADIVMNQLPSQPMQPGLGRILAVTRSGKITPKTVAQGNSPVSILPINNPPPQAFHIHLSSFSFRFRYSQ